MNNQLIVECLGLFFVAVLKDLSLYSNAYTLQNDCEKGEKKGRIVVRYRDQIE